VVALMASHRGRASRFPEGRLRGGEFAAGHRHLRATPCPHHGGATAGRPESFGFRSDLPATTRRLSGRVSIYGEARPGNPQGFI
jgi:hypothetical protein